MMDHNEEPESQQMKRMKGVWRKPAVRVGIAMLAVIVLITACVSLYLKSLTDLVAYGEVPGDSQYQTSETFDEDPIAEPTPVVTGLNIDLPTQPITPTPEPSPTPKPTEDPRIVDARNQQQAALEIAIPKSSKVYNILLIGSDRREGETTGRSDSMIILSINRSTKKIHLVSLMRGLYVNIPGRGFDLLNASYSYGGSRLLRQTIEENFRVRIDDFIMIDFDGFTQAINTVGGVDIDLTSAEADTLNKEFGAELLSGQNHLDGSLALGYSRIRHIDSDFSRTGRQRKVVQALISSAMSKNALELDAAIRDILPLIRTNLSGQALLGLGLDLVQYRDFPMSQLMLPVRCSYETMYVHRREVVKFDYDKNIDALHTFLFKD